MNDVRYSELFDQEQQERLIQAGDEISRGMWTVGSLVSKMAGDQAFSRSKVYSLATLCKAAGAFTLMPSRLVRLAAHVYTNSRLIEGVLGFWHYEQALRLPAPEAPLRWAEECVDELGRPATVDAMAAAFKSESNPDPAKTASKAREGARRRALEGLDDFIGALEDGTIAADDSKVLASKLRVVYCRIAGG